MFRDCVGKQFTLLSRWDGARENKMTRLVHRFLHDDSGATSIEYAAIASLLSIAIVTAALGLGSKLKDTYTGVSTALN